MTSQLTKLNTNTRYLSSGLVDYAQRLTALLPEELQVCRGETEDANPGSSTWKEAGDRGGGRSG